MVICLIVELSVCVLGIVLDLGILGKVDGGFGFWQLVGEQEGNGVMILVCRWKSMLVGLRMDGQLGGYYGNFGERSYFGLGSWQWRWKEDN